MRAGEAEEDWFSGKEMAAKERQIDDLQSEIERLRFLIPPAAGGAAVDGSYTPYRGSGGTPHDTPHRTELERENARLKDALRLVSESRRSDGAGVPPTGGAALSAGDLQALLLSMQALPLHARTSLPAHIQCPRIAHAEASASRAALCVGAGVHICRLQSMHPRADEPHVDRNEYERVRALTTIKQSALDAKTEECNALREDCERYANPHPHSRLS